MMQRAGASVGHRTDNVIRDVMLAPTIRSAARIVIRAHLSRSRFRASSITHADFQSLGRRHVNCPTVVLCVRN
jgi:hypothetical protein